MTNPQVNTHRCGDLYWCISLADGKTVLAYADEVSIKPDGSLILYNPEEQFNLAFAAGRWVSIYAASVVDGGAVAVDAWE